VNFAEWGLLRATRTYARLHNRLRYQHQLMMRRNNMFRLFKIWQQKKRVLLAASILVLGYEPGLKHEYDPDELRDLNKEVEKLREMEKK
jgi:hypothetical protein